MDDDTIMMILLLLGAVVFGLVATVFFFFGTDDIATPWIAFGLVFFLLGSFVLLEIKGMSWETYFYGFNWLGNPDAWKWLTTPIGK